MSEKQTVYLETSVISYITSRLSRDYLVSAHQRLTREWWETHRQEFQLFISETVVREISVGDKEESQRRMSLVREIPVLTANAESEKLVEHFFENHILPRKAINDAFHLAISAVSGIDFLITWNCKHLANIEVMRSARQVCHQFDYEAPLVYTPLEFMGEEIDEP